MTPGPTLLLLIILGLVLLSIYISIIRWVYRINERVELLRAICEQLKNLNAKGEGK